MKNNAFFYEYLFNIFLSQTIKQKFTVHKLPRKFFKAEPELFFDCFSLFAFANMLCKVFIDFLPFKHFPGLLVSNIVLKESVFFTGICAFRFDRTSESLVFEIFLISCCFLVDFSGFAASCDSFWLISSFRMLSELGLKIYQRPLLYGKLLIVNTHVHDDPKATRMWQRTVCKCT